MIITSQGAILTLDEETPVVGVEDKEVYFVLIQPLIRDQTNQPIRMEYKLIIRKL